MPKTKFHTGGEELYGDVIISGSVSGAWQPGYLGNNEYIAIPPGDFMLNEVSRTVRLQSNDVELGYSLTDGGTLVASRTNGEPGGGHALYAIKIIPKGFRAYAAIVHGVDTSGVSRWQAFTSTIVDESAANLTLLPAVNVQINFTSKVVGDGLSYIVLSWARNHILNSSLLGAQIFIEPDI